MAGNSPTISWVPAVPAGAAEAPQLRIQRPFFVVTSPTFRAFSKGQTIEALSDHVSWNQQRQGSPSNGFQFISDLGQAT